MDLDDAAIVEEEDTQNTSGMVGFDDNPLICCRSALPRIFALFQRRYVLQGEHDRLGKLSHILFIRN